MIKRFPCAQKNDAKNPFDILNLDAAFMEALDHKSTYLGAGDYQTGEVEAARRVRLAFTQLVKKDHVDKRSRSFFWIVRYGTLLRASRYAYVLRRRSTRGKPIAEACTLCCAPCPVSTWCAPCSRTDYAPAGGEILST